MRAIGTWVQTVPSVVSKIEAKMYWGGWADVVCTQMKDFKPLYLIPDYSHKYTL